MNATKFKVRPLAQEHITLYESPNPETIYCYTPGLAVSPDGKRIIATIDVGGPGVANLPGERFESEKLCQSHWQGKVFTSDDKGETWQFRANFAGLHARPFYAGDTLYILGQAGNLVIFRSDDNGETWSEGHFLTQGEDWHQSACNVHYANGCVYLVMEKRVTFDIKWWTVGEVAPVLMRAPLDADLTKRESWTFASEISFRDVINNTDDCPELDWHGIPFYHCPYPSGGVANGQPDRNCAPIGWLESNVVQFVDPNHYWYDPEEKTFHIWMRAHTGGTGYACVMKVVEQGNVPGTGAMTTMLQTVPSGKKILYVPFPGGQMRFHVLYDDETHLYWLLSTQATDSMTRADRLPEGRFNLPNNERRRLQLHFSKNMIDWCFAGLICSGPVEIASRHYASMIIDGDDLQVLSRSGDEHAKNPHDGNIITLHTIDNFRELVY